MLARIGLSAALAALVLSSPAWAEYKSKVTVNIDQKLTLGGMDAGTKGTTVV